MLHIFLHIIIHLSSGMNEKCLNYEMLEFGTLELALHPFSFTSLPPQKRRRKQQKHQQPTIGQNPMTLYTNVSNRVCMDVICGIVALWPGPTSFLVCVCVLNILMIEIFNACRQFSVATSFALFAKNENM